MHVRVDVSTCRSSLFLFLYPTLGMCNWYKMFHVVVCVRYVIDLITSVALLIKTIKIIIINV